MQRFAVAQNFFHIEGDMPRHIVRAFFLNDIQALAQLQAIATRVGQSIDVINA